MSKPEPSEEKAKPSGTTEPKTNPAIPRAHLKQVTMTQISDDAARSQTEPPPGGVVDPYIGHTIDGRYFVEALLGEGGMGVVYRCRHTIIDKKVAMKVLRADMARNEEVTERFLNEARSASSIGNPHIIDISDFGRLPDGATYFVMEFLVGTPLAELAEARVPLDPARAGHIALQLTEGLSDAHESGIIHRDLKPDNIFLINRGSEQDFVKILDFGIAKASTNSSKLTQAGQVFGTPHYMSPEQAAGSPVDQRSDIYAVGVILYELTTGQLPFDADNFMAILTQHMYKAPLPPSEVEGLQQQLPAGLEDVILRCLAKEPGQRYQTMAELGEDLRRIFAGLLPIASSREMPSVAGVTDNFGSAREFRSSGAPLPPKSSAKSRAGLAAAAVLIVAAAGAYFALGQSTKPQAPESAVMAVPPPVVDADEAAADEKANEPETTPVAIAVAPLQAHVFRGGEDLGQSPVMVQVGQEPMTLTAKLEGYVTQELTIDGSRDRVTVDLEKDAPKAPVVQRHAPEQRRVVAPKPKPAPNPKSIGGNELVDPWE